MVRPTRGRSAALRHLWSWPVYSGRRFAGCVVLLLVLVIVGGKLARTAAETDPSPSPAMAVTVTPSPAVDAP